MRRGQLQIPFQWIFALVGGALFLFFFFMVIRSVLQTSEETQEMKLEFALDASLKTAATNPETFTVIQLPGEHRMTFDCGFDGSLRDFTSASVRVDDQSYDPMGLRHVPLFSAPRITDDQLLVLTRSWHAPFIVTRLMMVAGNRTGYYLISRLSQLDATKELVRSENIGGFDLRVITVDSLDSIEPSGNENYRFVLFDINYNDFLARLDARFRQPENGAVQIITDDFEQGRLIFYDNLQGTAPSGPAIHFVGGAMLDAAIFSNGILNYQCNMRKAYDRLVTAIIVHRERTARLVQAVDAGHIDPQCRQYYIEALQHLARYLTDSRGVGVALQSINRPPVFFDMAVQGDGPIPELEELNGRLLKNDCPLIY